jgi:catechol 2,3-dioxygenase-like lactoylglutathione lyase family enzyme
MSEAIQSTIPVLPSLNLQQSVDFYTGRLGFKEAARHPDYAILVRDGCELHFWPCTDKSLSKNSSCYIRTKNTDALYDEFKGKGVELKEPVIRPWGMKELYVIDPHGNLLKFGESV